MQDKAFEMFYTSTTHRGPLDVGDGEMKNHPQPRVRRMGKTFLQGCVADRRRNRR